MTNERGLNSCVSQYTEEEFYALLTRTVNIAVRATEIRLKQVIAHTVLKLNKVLSSSDFDEHVIWPIIQNIAKKQLVLDSDVFYALMGDSSPIEVQAIVIRLERIVSRMTLKLNCMFVDSDFDEHVIWSIIKKISDENVAIDVNEAIERFS